jgi:hypothetical protein
VEALPIRLSTVPDMPVKTSQIPFGGVLTQTDSLNSTSGRGRPKPRAFPVLEDSKLEINYRVIIMFWHVMN